jgi:type II secretory pathway component PulF
MAVFEYSAMGADGSRKKGNVEASDLNRARQKLKEQNLRILNIAEKKGGFSFLNQNPQAKNQQIGKGKADKIALGFLIKFHQLIKSGMPVGDASKTLASRLRDPSLQGIAERLWKELSDGATVAKALGEYPHIFDSTLLHMMEAGEATGNLEPILANMIGMIQARIDIRKKISSGLAYPFFISVVACFVVAFFLFYLLPRIEMMLESMGGEMSWSAAAILWIAEMSFVFGPVVIVGGLVAAIFINQWRKKPEGRLITDQFLLKVPVISNMIMNAEQSRIANLASTLLDSGVSATEALKLIEKGIQNLAFKERFRKARSRINDGISFSGAFSENQVFDEMDSDVLAISENTGKAVQGFQSLYLAKYELIEEHMKKLTLTITSIALVFAFSLVVLLTFGIATSILQLSRNIIGD